MNQKAIATYGCPISSEHDLKRAYEFLIKLIPDFINDGISKKDLVKLYRKRTQPYKHVVLFNIDDSWYLKFLLEEEVIHYIPLK